MSSKFSFAFVHIEHIDEPKCKFILKMIAWYASCVFGYFYGVRENNFWYNFGVPLALAMHYETGPFESKDLLWPNVTWYIERLTFDVFVLWSVKNVDS